MYSTNTIIQPMHIDGANTDDDVRS